MAAAEGRGQGARATRNGAGRHQHRDAVPDYPPPSAVAAPDDLGRR
jgi:hypothetical protein